MTDDVAVETEQAEEWRELPGFAGAYEVSDLGRVRSLRFTPPKIMWQGLKGGGYPYVRLWFGRRLHTGVVHRLVCRAFNGEQPNPLHNEVAHLDGNPLNCRPSNLKWVSRRENMSHKELHGTVLRGARHARARLSDEQAREAVARLAVGENCMTIARDFGVARSTIESILRGRNWRHLPRPDKFDRPRSTGNGQRGKRNHAAKFDDETAAEIRRRRQAGETCQALADEYGVWKGTISRIGRGEAYRTVVAK